MDFQKPKSQKTNPRENANWFSIIFYTYVFDLFRIGARKDLNVDDLYCIVKDFESETLCNRLDAEWKIELKKKNPSILKALFRMFRLEFVLWGLGSFIFSTAVFTVAQPIMTDKLMAYFESGNTVSKSEATSYVIGMLVLMTSFILFDNLYLFTVLGIGLKVRSACCSLVYQKCLKLDLNVNPEYKGGKAITLMTKDVTIIANELDFGHMLPLAFPRTVIVICVMYRSVGITALVAAGCLLILVPINILVAKLSARYRLKTAEKTDKRIKVTQEILTSMRIVKMYTWERFFNKFVNNLRWKEVKNIRILYYVEYFSFYVGEMGIRFIFYICVIVYISLENHITAGSASVLVYSFSTLQLIFTVFISLGISKFAQLQISFERITDFLTLEEIPNRSNDDYKAEKMGEISIKGVSVKTAGDQTVLDNINLDVGKGLTLVSGPTGAGKSTLLKLLIGDVDTDGKVHLNGTISYASQEPWIFPATIRQNILFGQEFDHSRYTQVVQICALQKDIDGFSHGDNTLVTDKGLNLSKGQKARINLARAVYKKADIYLIDDCFSSVDSRVGNHIFSECIQIFLKSHTCVLVTHNSGLVEYADHYIFLDKGSVKYVDKKDKQTDSESTEEKNGLVFNIIEEAVINDEENEYSSLLGKRTDDIYEESKQGGVVSKRVYYAYMMSAGGWKMTLLVILCSVVAQATASWTDYFVSFWVDVEQELNEFQINNTNSSESYQYLNESRDSIIKLYLLTILMTAVSAFIRTFVIFWFTSKASTNIHRTVFGNILKSGIIFFDTHLSGNILNRFSRDMGLVDEHLPFFIHEFLKTFLSLIAVFGIVSSVTAYFVIPSILFTIILYFGRNYYMKTGRNMLRLEGSARSPVIGHLNATMEGLSTIRANGAQQILKNEFDKHQDHFTSVSHTNLSTKYGFCLYLDLISICYIAIVQVTFLFLKTDSQVGKITLAITQSQTIAEILRWGIRMWSELERNMTSTERILEYEDVKTEDTTGKTNEDWPKHGSITYKNVSLCYSPHSKRVLKDINFKIEPREKIGVVGRTGAGKTSITSTMFRMYDFEGVIEIDNVDIKTLSISHLRSKVSIIPQDPVLFSGTVRNNLDPYCEYSDAVLWSALDEVEMKTSITSLDNPIYEGGFEFSAGEKQLFCLARAIVRNNIILILDEATANIDARTDLIIQKVMKKKFCDCTIITIAHKLNTILDSDKVLVMDSGKVSQFGPPSELLKDHSGLFYTMVSTVGLV